MTTLSIRLPDSLLKEVDKRASELQIPRAEYIRRAIASLNSEVVANQRQRRLVEASLRVRESSMRVNAEFDIIEDAPNA